MARPSRIADLWDNASWHTRDRLFLAWTEYESDNKIANEEYELLRDAEIAAEESAAASRAVLRGVCATRQGSPAPRNAAGQETCRKGLHLFSGDNLLITTYKGKTVRKCRACVLAAKRERDKRKRDERAEPHGRTEVA